jgi:hypothetical protein
MTDTGVPFCGRQVFLTAGRASVCRLMSQLPPTTYRERPTQPGSTHDDPLLSVSNYGAVRTEAIGQPFELWRQANPKLLLLLKRLERHRAFAARGKTGSLTRIS